jgi:hypothetical protein
MPGQYRPRFVNMAETAPPARNRAARLDKSVTDLDPREFLHSP